MPDTQIPVLIVGAGVAGLTCSAVLAQQGMGSLLVERRRERFIYPKARNLSFRSLEILRRLGLAEEVHHIGEGVASVVVKSTLNSPEASTAMDLDAIFAGMDDVSPEKTVQYCPQSRLEPLLLAETRRRGSTVRYGTELIGWEQDADGVTATIRDVAGGDTETVRAHYLVAADGTRSPIRRALGIPVHGHGALPIFVVFVYFRGPWRKFLSDNSDGGAVQIVNSAVNGILVAAEDDLGMFIITYLPSEGESAEQFTPQRCHQLLLAAVGEPMDVEIIETTSWQPREHVAEQFRSGRVFLLGDAAHTMPPLKGGGANCAMQSADNLAWKLAAVLNGQAGPELLDTYHVERHPVGVFSARQSLIGPTRAMLRIDGDAPELAPGEEASMFALLAGYQYRSAATVPGHNTTTGTINLVQTLRGQVGTRVPHVWVQRQGERVSTLDLLGPAFTLLTAGDGNPWPYAAAQVAAELGVGVDVVVIDRDNQWTSTTGLPSDGALLVRPDAFLGWRCDRMPNDPKSQLRQVLSQILAR